MKKHKILSQSPKIPNIGTNLGSVTIIGPGFSIRHDSKKYVMCVVECNQCKTTNVHRLTDLKYRAKRGDILCTNCSKIICDNNLHPPVRIDDRQTKKLYWTWCNMRGRCNGKLYKHNKSYYERKIKVCESWNTWINFRDWAYDNGYYDQPKGIAKSEVLTIDRINPYKDYCPENCRWVTFAENAKNVTKCRDDVISLLESRVKYLETMLKNNKIKFEGDNL